MSAIRTDVIENQKIKFKTGIYFYTGNRNIHFSHSLGLRRLGFRIYKEQSIQCLQ